MIIDLDGVPESQESDNEIGHTQADLERHRMSIWILLASGLIGLIGDIFFHSQGVGINVFLYTAAFLGLGVGLLRYLERPISRKNIYFIGPALIFAALIGVRSATYLSLANGMLLGGFVFLVVRYATVEAFIGGRWSTPIVDALESSILVWLDGPFNIIPDSMAWFKHRDWDAEQSETFRAVVRGLILTLPILLIFGLMLSSADVVFGDFLKGSFSWIQVENPASIFSHLLVIALFGWLGLAGYKLMVLGPFQGGTVRSEINKTPQVFGEGLKFQLGMIETSMVLGSVNGLFGMFVLIQARYFFGGDANITAQGYTYSEYARRGFIELLAVSLMTMALVLVLDHITQRNQKQERLFRGLAIMMIGFTMVLMVAAFRRLSLYEDAFGFTRLRVITQVFMVWLGVLFFALVAAIMSKERRWFWGGFVVVSLCFVATLSVLNVDGFIAGRNIDRFEDTGKLDADYLLSLSDDAIPAAVGVLELDIEEEEWYETLMQGLADRLVALDADKDERGIFGFHVGKRRAWNALDTYREELEAFRLP